MHFVKLLMGCFVFILGNLAIAADFPIYQLKAAQKSSRWYMELEIDHATT
ncbi:MAG: hypothetical protein GAK29_03161 [Acinetobacter bereziniae]|uniref:Uncharacterized protein n=1 Tax=Acinetobacter bereziniae TaxID=106648 RepID=A0A833PEG6_ACIBZ|nr:MAG: hypothetical protein GAK29_03161 [Acinetobacter bereziniae]